MARGWQEDGVKLIAEISTSGNLLTPAFDLVPPNGPGSSGVIGGWAKAYFQSGTANFAYVNYSYDENYIQKIEASASNPYPLAIYGMTSTYSVIPNHTYMILVTAAFTPGMPNTVFVVATRRDDTQAWGTKISSSLTEAFNDYIGFVTPTTDSITVGVQLQQQLNSVTTGNNALWGCFVKKIGLLDLDDPNTNITPTFTWRDVTCDVVNVRTRYGRQTYSNRFEVGTTVVDLNNVSGDYRWGNDWGFQPGRLFRLRAQYSGTEYPMALGVIDTIDGDVEIDGKAGATLTVLDPSSLASRTDVPTIRRSSTATSISVQDRMNYLLNVLGYATSSRKIDAGSYLMQLINGSGRSIRDELGLTADSDSGAFYAERNGDIYYQNRNWPLDATYGNQVQATIHAEPRDQYIDQSGPDAVWDDAEWDIDVWPVVMPSEIPNRDSWSDAPTHVEICSNVVQTDWSLANVVNMVLLANAGGTAREYTNAWSQREYGLQTYSRMDLLGTSRDNLDTFGQRVLSARSDAPFRLNRCTYTMSAQPPTVWPFTLSVFFGWAVRVRYFNLKTGWNWQSLTHVQAIEHVITPTSWSINLDVDNALIPSEDR